MANPARHFKTLWVIALTATLFGYCAIGATAEETQDERDQRMGWWREAKFGMFVHWGLYAIPAGIWKDKPVGTAGEWIMFGAKIPVDEYEPLVNEFNPVKFDAKQWVRIAKQAGMKYIVITSKHHDGFCLFDSASTDYDVMNTPFKRDIMKELSEECHKQGIKICWYHSILDWHHPDYLPRGEGSPRPWDTRPTEGASYDRYIEYMKGQLRELLTKYGEIGILWFDGGWEHKPEEHHSQEVVDLIRSIQPSIIINNRIGIPQDYDTPEQKIPATGIPGRDWETCMTMNGTWGFKRDDHNWKSTEDLIRKLVDIVSKGGNFLLNVGPTAEGLIPQPSVERLAAMGEWLEVNGESIYGASPSVFKRLPWGRCTTKPGKLFLHVFDWPEDGQLEVLGLINQVKKAYLLSDPQHTQLDYSRSAQEVLTVAPGDVPDPTRAEPNPWHCLLVKVPASAPDLIDTVVALEIEGQPEIAVPIQQPKDGVITLKAVDAAINGTTARYESSGGLDNIGFWTNPKDSVSWKFVVAKPGAFQVQITYACENGVGGSTYTINVGDQEVPGEVKDTTSWTDFVTEEIGTLKLPEPGKYTLTVQPKAMPGYAVMNLKAVTLRPVK